MVYYIRKQRLCSKAGCCSKSGQYEVMQAYPSPWRSFSKTTTQMLSLCSRVTKSALSLMMSGMVMTPKSVTHDTIAVKYTSTCTHHSLLSNPQPGNALLSSHRPSNRYRTKRSASAHQDFPPDLRRYLGREEPRSLGGSHKAIPDEGQDEGPHGNLHGHRGPAMACGRSSLMLLQENPENTSYAFIC